MALLPSVPAAQNPFAESAATQAGAATATPSGQNLIANIADINNKGIIEDFGEKLPLARRAMAAKLNEDLTDVAIESQPLSKIWPLKENEAIEDKFSAAVASVMRENIPAKPRKRRRYLNKYSLSDTWCNGRRLRQGHCQCYG